MIANQVANAQLGANAKPARLLGKIKLIKEKGQTQNGHARPEGRGDRARTRVAHDGRDARKEPHVGNRLSHERKKDGEARSKQ